MLISLISVSLGIHLLLLMHISGLYRSDALTFIELSVRDLSEPFTRSIPRPRLRRDVPEVQDIQKLDIREQRIPAVKVDPLQNRTEYAGIERTGSPKAPDMPDISGLKVGEWASAVSPADFMTRQDYLEMLRLRIESRKKFPESARSSHIEGRAQVRFLITSDGHVASAEVVKSSGNQILDQAAVRAVTDAAPFPKPPPNLFKGPLHMKITLVFELM